MRSLRLCFVAGAAALTQIPVLTVHAQTMAAESAPPEGAASDPAPAPTPAPSPATVDSPEGQAAPVPPAPARQPDAAAEAAVSPPAATTVTGAAQPPVPAQEETAPPEEPVEPEDEGVAGWFRIDSDALSLQLWVGATHSLGPVDIATDVYVTSGAFGEFDIGPVFTFGPVSLTPMAGIGFDWSDRRTVTLIAPQLFSIVSAGPIYFESWIQLFFNSIFEEAHTPGADTFYTRNFLLLKLSEQFGIGPQMEATVALNDAAGDGLLSLPVGGQVGLGYGKNNTLGLFLGYETEEEARTFDREALDEDGAVLGSYEHDHGLVGRITFIRTW